MSNNSFRGRDDGLLYILAGPDDFSRDRALEEIKATSIGDPASAATCTTVLDGQHVSPDEIRSVCATAPFFAEKRLVIIHGLLARLDAGGKAEQQGIEGNKQNDTSAFAAALRQIPESTVIVMIEDDVPKNTGLFKELSAGAVVRTFPLLKEAALRSWIQKRVAGLGGSISPQAISLLCQLIGSNLWILASEVDKLVLFAGTRRIEEGDVRSLVGYTQDVSIFALIDAVVDFNSESAGRLLQQLLRQGAAPAYILFMLDRQFRMVVRAKELKNQGRPDTFIQSTLGIRNDFALRRTLEQAGRYSAARLRQIYGHLLETDLAMKTGRYSSELALDLLIAELCQHGARAASRHPGS